MWVTWYPVGPANGLARSGQSIFFGLILTTKAIATGKGLSHMILHGQSSGLGPIRWSNHYQSVGPKFWSLARGLDLDLNITSNY